MTCPGLAVNLVEQVPLLGYPLTVARSAGVQAERSSVQFRSDPGALPGASGGEVRLLAASSGVAQATDAESALDLGACRP